jgi:Predicted phosphohydrolases
VSIIHKLKKRHITYCALFILLVSILLAGLNNKLTVTEYTIRTGKTTAGIEIVLLTDLHSCSYGEGQNQLIEAINKQNPDIILMAGDIADDVLPDEKVIELLRGIAYKYPCYYVTGNHEFWSGRVDEQKEMFRAYGVNVLEGTGDTVYLNGQEILICGVDDPDGGWEMFEDQLNNVAQFVQEDKYTILLAHRPELNEMYSTHLFDLVLSGHAHGGQWSIPLILPNGLFAPNQGIFPKYTKGICEFENTKMLVSRGLSRESTQVPRFFNPPELVVIHLVP